MYLKVEIFKLLLKVCKLDNNIFIELKTLIDFFIQHNPTFDKNIFLTEFDINILKMADEEQKQFIFNSALFLAFLDGFSEKEEAFITEISIELNFPQIELIKLREEIQNEISQTNDFTPLEWFNRMIKGYIEFWKTGITPYDSYFSFRHLHFLSNGRINDLMSFVAEVVNPPYQIDLNSLNGMTGINNTEKLDKMVKNLNQDGYHIFDKTLSEDLCKKLVSFALKNPCIPQLPKVDYQEFSQHGKVLFNPKNPVSIRNDFDTRDLIQNELIQEICSNPDFIFIAQNYFKSKVALNHVTMWWSATGETETRYSGQVYHIDMDRSKCLFFFIYLTDVNTKNGPHIYVKGTHKRKPFDLIKDKRMTDKDLHDFYEDHRFIELTGKKGTIIAGDTRCFHKGKPLVEGNRLMLQLFFSTDLYGEAIAKIKQKKYSKTFEKARQKYPYTFSLYDKE